jgi:hypothetical protein
MDPITPITVIFIALGFTGFGYAWGRPSAAERSEMVRRAVELTIDSLEKDGYVKTETRNGEVELIKWPK